MRIRRYSLGDQVIVGGCVLRILELNADAVTVVIEEPEEWLAAQRRLPADAACVSKPSSTDGASERVEDSSNVFWL